MLRQESRWVFRTVTDGEIYYDRRTRRVFRRKPENLNLGKEKVFTLDSFEADAPIKAYFDFTYLCNLECRHCITNSSARIERKGELSTGMIKQILNELAAVGIMEVGIGGGEPLCHPDLFTLLSHATSVGLNTVVTTNGVLINAEKARCLKDAGVTEVRVSFDGPEAIHNDIRGKGVYRKALKGLQILVQSKVNTVSRLTLCKGDFEGLDILFKELKAVGATSIKAALIEPRGRASLSQNQDLFDFGRNESIANVVKALAKNNNLKLTLPSDLAGEDEFLDGGELRLGKIKSCGAGLETVYISPTGNIQPCSGTPEYNFGNLKSESFMEIWLGTKGLEWRRQMRSCDTWCICINKTVSKDLNGAVKSVAVPPGVVV